MYHGNPMVSVVLRTYYHEAYVRQALEGILTQKTNFPYEILVGDDASGDGTQAILLEYQKKYPDKFFMVLREKNLGATKNSYEVFRMSRGKYIALLEGDDYWIDANKLQLQVDFLEAHTQYIGCCHKCVVVNEHGTPDYTASPHWVRNKKVFTLQDYLKSWETFGQTATVVFRNFFLNAEADYSDFYRIHKMVGDKTLALMLLAQGDFYCMNRVMSAYRSVIKKGGKNWFSLHHADPYWQYSAFMHPCRLERYARQAFGIRQHLGPRKEYHYVSFVEDLLKKPSLTRLRYLLEMIASSHDPARYVVLTLKPLWNRWVE